MTLEAIERTTAPDPRTSIIVLHGLGADGNDFVPFAQELDLRAIGPVRWIFPHAPMRPVTINGGVVMRAWYDIRGNDIALREDETTLRASRVEVDALIDREIARGIAPGRIVLAGFSQGCAMALLCGLRYPQRLGGLVGMSGYLALAATTTAERHAANHDVPVFLAHGQMDGVIPIDRAERSRDILAGLGHAVEWHAYPMAHSVCAEEVVHLNRWLLRLLAA